ncbi:MAG: 4-(cytidine 5'-diphospho)-2-C-methyl-D-erythritol kinase [Candidatus Cloacimonetes bacterium]|nr:4-(cytidine 5'-diphospho)-2-C-methyl-D-erythritol kinase [Candidatus Cloacimonadota bacterium]
MPAASYAKINLSLEVLGKLPDGYHRVETLFASVDLYDTLKYTLTKNPGIKLWSDVSELSTPDNLIYQVAEHLRQAFRPGVGARIELFKRIPIAAGLGGGSSNAAITILALNRLWELRLSEEKLDEVAARFGSDINFFLQGGCCLGEERGQRITPMDDVLIDNILLVNPGLRISSAEAYKLVDLSSVSQRGSYQDFFRSGVCFNRLEPGIRSRYPLIDEIIRKMTEAGARTAVMSGSGSTCFGIFDSNSALQTCRQAFEAKGFWTHKTRTIGKEEYQKCTQSLN